MQPNNRSPVTYHQFVQTALLGETSGESSEGMVSAVPGIASGCEVAIAGPL
jgi:hypothetical protein